MDETRRFRRSITTRFLVIILLALLLAAFSLHSLMSVIGAKDLVLSDHAHELIEARALENASEHQVSSTRAYLLTGDPHFLEQARKSREAYRGSLDRLRATRSLPDEARLLDHVAESLGAHEAALEEALQTARASNDPRPVVDVFEAAVVPKREALRTAFRDLIGNKEDLLNAAIEMSRTEAGRATVLVAALGAAAVLVAVALFIMNTRTLVRLSRTESELRELNESLESRVSDRTRELQHAIGELEGFAYTIAHDLRAPLRTMAGLGQLVLSESGPRLDENGRSDLARIVDGSRRMDDLIRGLLELIRLSHADFPVTDIAPHDLIWRVIQTKQSSIRAKDADVDAEGDFPSVRGNAALLTLAFEELIANALEFTRAGVAPLVRVRSEQAGAKVRIVVQDNGIGISEDYRERIFGVFNRLNRMEDHPGVGIGLALVRRAAERMGGRAGLASMPGAGSSFWIELEVAGPQNHSATSPCHSFDSSGGAGAGEESAGGGEAAGVRREGSTNRRNSHSTSGGTKGKDS